MGASNPFLGGYPVMPQAAGGAIPNGADSDGATATLGGAMSGSVPTRSTPATLGTLVLLAAGVILVIHVAGVRTSLTASVGK